MFDDLRNLIGREGLIAVALYAGMAWLAADPISHRVAVRDHLATCVTTVTMAGPSNSASDLGHADQWLRNLGPYGEWGRGLLDLERQYREAEARRRAEAIARLAPDACRCRIDLARAATRTDWALWVGTLKLYRPTAVTEFATVIARADREGVCKRSAAS